MIFLSVVMNKYFEINIYSLTHGSESNTKGLQTNCMNSTHDISIVELLIVNCNFKNLRADCLQCLDVVLVPGYTFYNFFNIAI